MVATPENIVSQQMEISRDRIRIRLITTTNIDPEQVKQAERHLLRQTGKDASILVRRVASEEELATLRESLRTPAPPPVRDIESVRPELLAQLEAPLRETWPENGGEMTAYELGFDPEGVVLRLRCKSEKPFDEVAQAVLAKAIQSRLRVSKMRLLLEYEDPSTTSNDQPSSQRNRAR
jgi:hypothetical protein